MSTELIINIGKDILKDFFSKSLVGQLASALQAPGECPEPSTKEEVRDYMKCTFLKGQREAWEIILLLFFTQFIFMVVITIIVYAKGRKVVNRWTNQAQATNVNVGCIAHTSPSLSMHQTGGQARAMSRSSSNSRATPIPPRDRESPNRFREIDELDF